MAEGSGVSGLNECTAKTVAGEFEGGLMKREEDGGSEFGEWTVSGAASAVGCEPTGVLCGVLAFGNFSIKGTFNKIPLPKFTLTTSTSGTAGSVECKINGGAKGPCPEGAEEVEETSSVEMFAEPGVGNELNEWTSGPCAGEAVSPCSFPMPAANVSANADFVTASETLSVSESGGGTGSVTCKVNNVSAPCNGTYEYNDTVEVEAEPDEQMKVESITGPGCSISGEGLHGEGASCSFTLTSNTTVAVVFETAGTKDEADVNTVNGEVPIKTALESSCPSVYLGEFEAGVTHNYHNTCTVKLTSTGVETELTAADETGEAPTGHLVQDYVDKNSVAHHYFLPSALEVAATDSEGKATGGVGSTLTGLDPNPVTLLAFEEPIAKDQTTLEFNQPIGNHDGLHTGPYSKTITLTLEQTTP